MGEFEGLKRFALIRERRLRDLVIEISLCNPQLSWAGVGRLSKAFQVDPIIGRRQKERFHREHRVVPDSCLEQRLSPPRGTAKATEKQRREASNRECFLQG